MLMETFWFAIVSAMLAVYVVLDGFDFGAGVLHRLVAKTEDERQTVLAAIEPVLHGNEVWLLAAGGLLFLAFPRLYAVALSGLYLAVMIALWLLILRGIAIGFRSHQENPLWREFWDATFSISSILLAATVGIVLGNVVRGVPLETTSSFALPLFTNFQPGARPGFLDWYTLLMGLFTLCALTAHGALYLVWKTSGPVRDRSRAWARKAGRALVPLGAAAVLATAWVQPALFQGLVARPWAVGLAPLVPGGFLAAAWSLGRGRELPAFVSSCVCLLGLLGTTAAANDPVWLRSTLDPAHDLTVANTAAASYGLRVAAIWWAVGMALAGGYGVYVFRSIRGKFGPHDEGQGP